jgi:RND superfamily putative drug exporter
MILFVVIGLIIVLLAILASLALPLMAVATIGLSIAWSLSITYIVMAVILGTPLFFFDRVILFIVMLGLGMDYNIFILTRIREEKTKVSSTKEAVVTAVTYTGGVITAAAVILASVFFVLGTSSFALIATIGFSLGIAIILDATLVRTYIMPALISLMGEKVWWIPGRKQKE